MTGDSPSRPCREVAAQLAVETDPATILKLADDLIRAIDEHTAQPKAVPDLPEPA